MVHIRPRNTDWLYNRSLPEISRFNPNVEIYLERSLSRALAYNTRAAMEIVKSRLHLPVPGMLLPEIQSRFDLGDLRRSQADVIYGHSPTNVTHLPLVCHTGPIFEDELRSRGVSEEEIAREKREKGATIRRSQLTTLHSEVGAATLRQLAGKRSDRVRVLPFFLPHLQRVAVGDVERKFDDLRDVTNPIRMLFVGREANRKGLAAVVGAFLKLDAAFPGRLHLEVVSRFADGPVEIPQLANLTLTGETARADVAAKMRAAHFLLMPSRFETFGWVYLEAMAAGAIALAADCPTQSEILAGGTAGLLSAPTEEAVADTLEPLLSDPTRMLALALVGQARVAAEYDPTAVAKKFQAIGEEAQELFRRDLGEGGRQGGR
jgi:glycosyltransferase involved in cell wall biosynthesis